VARLERPPQHRVLVQELQRRVDLRALRLLLEHGADDDVLAVRGAGRLVLDDLEGRHAGRHLRLVAGARGAVVWPGRLVVVVARGNQRKRKRERGGRTGAERGRRRAHVRGTSWNVAGGATLLQAPRRRRPFPARRAWGTLDRTSRGRFRACVDGASV